MSKPTLEVIASSIEEAFSKGEEQFNVNRDALDVEILDEGSKGFLGIGSRQMRIRVSLKSDEDTGTKTKSAAKSKTSKSAQPAEIGNVEADVIYVAEQTAEDLLNKMKLRGKVLAKFGEPDENGETSLFVDITGNDLSPLIGRKAETLNSLQYLLTLMVSKQLNHWTQVIVDVEGYRVRRNRQLKQLAHRMAEQAVKTNRRQILEPMSSSERRVIHIELKDHADVTTESIGEGAMRKVSILPKK